MNAPGLDSARGGQRRRSRRLAFALALVAAAFYVGFIAVSIFAGRT